MGSYCAKGVPDVGPEVSLIARSFPVSSVTEWLAGIAGCYDINRGHVIPVDFRYVAEVGDSWEVASHNPGSGIVVFGVPNEVATDGEIQPTVSAEQAADPHASDRINTWRCSAASGSGP